MSGYQAKHNPPLAWERWVMHAGESVFGVWSIIQGALVFLDPFLSGVAFSKSLGELPYGVAIALGLFLVLGGTCVLVGLLNHWQKREYAWGLEFAGWSLTSSGHVGYAAAVFAAFPSSVNAWGLSLAIAALGLVRGIALCLAYRDGLAEARRKQTGEQRKVDDHVG